MVALPWRWIRGPQAALVGIGTLISCGPRRIRRRHPHGHEGRSDRRPEEVLRPRDPDQHLRPRFGVQHRPQAGRRQDRCQDDPHRPGCPASAYIHQDVKRKLEQLQGVKEAVVNIVWEPPWTPEMMSETAKKQFGWGI